MLRTATLLASVLVLGLLAGCRGGPPDPPRRVFLITVDTLRADRVGAYGYPRATTPTVDRWAAEGVLFEQAVAQWPKTGPSFASLFTGLYPQTTGLTHEAAVRVPEGYLTLPELFQRAGYTTVAVVSNGVLNPELGWDSGFDEFVPTWDVPEGESEDPVTFRRALNAPRVNELALPLLERHRDDERLLVWLHYSDPHAPYVLPEGIENPFLGDSWYTGEALAELDGPAAALGERRDLKYYVAQYDANVRVVDDHLAEVAAHAERLGLLDDALLVLTSDHGESLGEHGYFFGHGRLPYNTTAHVPLIVRWPRRLPAGHRVAGPVELVDLYPTLRALVAPQLEVSGLEGESLLPWLTGAPPAPGRPGHAFSQAGGGKPLTHFRTVQDERWKLVYHPARRGRQGETPPRVELYDLAADPGETRDLHQERPDQLRRLLGELRAWMGGEEWIRRDRGFIEEQGEETQRALKALGYL